MQKRTTREIGNIGENAVAAYLMQNGYSILARGYTIRGGEIDIIAQKGGELAFVEVKSRKRGALTDGESAVNADKRRHLIRTAQSFYQTYSEEHGEAFCRFDVAVVELAGDKVEGVKYYVSAFDMSGS